MRQPALLAIAAAVCLLAARVALPADAQTGGKLFDTLGCYQCHGYVGQGGSAGPRIAPGPLPFAAFARYVRAPANQMPPYTAKVLTDEQLADIYAYLQSIPPPPAAKDLPQLKD